MRIPILPLALLAAMALAGCRPGGGEGRREHATETAAASAPTATPPATLIPTLAATPAPAEATPAPAEAATPLPTLAPAPAEAASPLPTLAPAEQPAAPTVAAAAPAAGESKTAQVDAATLNAALQANLAMRPNSPITGTTVTLGSGTIDIAFTASRMGMQLTGNAVIQPQATDCKPHATVASATVAGQELGDKLKETLAAEADAAIAQTMTLYGDQVCIEQISVGDSAVTITYH